MNAEQAKPADDDNDRDDEDTEQDVWGLDDDTADDDDDEGRSGSGGGEDAGHERLWNSPIGTGPVVPRDPTKFKPGLSPDEVKKLLEGK